MPDGRKEIYFGWLSTSTHSSIVFYSQSQQLADMFDDYAITLKERNSWFHGERRELIINGSKAMHEQVDIVNKRGRWLTVLLENDLPLNYGVVDIDFPAGKMAIMANIYNVEGRHLYEAEHDYRRILQYKNRIYFEYTKSSPIDGTISGICYYSLDSDGENDLIEGFNTRYQDNLKRIIQGVRVDDDPSAPKITAHGLQNLVREKAHLLMTKTKL